MEQLKNMFCGKICTIFTTPINRNFKEENPKTYPQPLYSYFMGLVEDINELGITLIQTSSNKRTFLFLRNVVSIAEEEVLDPSDPKDAATIENIKKEQKKTIESIESLLKSKQETIDPEQLQNIVKKL